MAKKSQKSSPRSLTSLLLTILILIIGVVFAEVTGIDILGVLEDPSTITVQPTATVQQSFTGVSGNVQTINLGRGIGAEKGFWTVYFNAPDGIEPESDDQFNSMDIQIVAAIDGVQKTLDAAMFELNNPIITDALKRAHERGVIVRIVADDEHGLDDVANTDLRDLQAAGIPVVSDERSALMHNKFMIMDSAVVWTGSWNYTINGTYNNNNNALVLRSPDAVTAYQAEFDEMFSSKAFGSTSPSTNSASFVQDGTPVQIYFASEDEVEAKLIEEVNNAESAVRFMSFSFTLDDLGAAVMKRAEDGLEVQGLFERTGASNRGGNMPGMFCAGLDVRLDGNSRFLHHKVFIIDDDTVITGSFNFSSSAVSRNDENVVIITDPDLAAVYLNEFNKLWDLASVPDNVEC